MLIRCEKCSTVYELEDRLVPPGGAPVQCSRCEHVFRAMPPARPAEAPRPLLREVPPPEPLAEPGDEGAAPGVPEAPWPPIREGSPSTPATAPSNGTSAPAGPASGGTLAAAAAGGSPERPAPVRAPTPIPGAEDLTPGPIAGMTADGRPIRKVRNPELEGGALPEPAAPRRAVSFPVGVKKKRPGSWVVAAAATLLAALAVVGVFLSWRERRAAAPPPPAQVLDPTSARKRQDGLALLVRDDAVSLERAARLLDESARREGTPAAQADRALALALLSQEAREESERLEGRTRAARDEAAAAEAAGDAARADALALDAEGFASGIAPARERAARLADEARRELDALPAGRQRDPVVLRARAMTHVALGQRVEAGRIARDARGLVSDPWLALAGVLAELPDGAGAAEHERALAGLEQLAKVHPELLRARFLAARIRAGMGDADGALAALEELLALNPEHLEARRLRAEVLAAQAPLPELEPPPTAAPHAQPVPPEGAPAEKPAAQPRNSATQESPR